MALLQAAQLAYTAYSNRNRIKRIALWLILALAILVFILYLIIATAFAILQGSGRISEGANDSGIPFTEFQSFTYKTISGTKWYEYVHPYYFPTLGVLTQGVILDSSAKV